MSGDLNEEEEKMQKYIVMFILGFLVVVACLVSAEADPAKPEPLRLTIEADKDVYSPDEPIHIDIRITNIGETYLGPGKSFLPEKKASPDVLIPKDIYVNLVAKGQGHFELGTGSLALDDETMEKVLTGGLEPLQREGFISIPPGHFYGRSVVVPPQAKIRGRLTCTYQNKLYTGKKAGIGAWTGRIESNVVDIRVQSEGE